MSFWRGRVGGQGGFRNGWLFGAGSGDFICGRGWTYTDLHGRTRTCTDVHGPTRTYTDSHGYWFYQVRLGWIFWVLWGFGGLIGTGFGVLFF